MLAGNPLNDSESGLDVEVPGGPDGDTSDIGSGLLSGGNHRPDQIPGGEAEMPLRPGQIPPGEPEGVEPCPLVGSPARCRDPENRTVRVQDMVDLPDARRVEGMGLWEAEPGPVELGPDPGSGLHGESGCPKPSEEGPSGGVHGRRIFERGFGPGENLLQKIRLLQEKFLDGSVPLLSVAGPAGEGQVGDAIRSAEAFGVDVVDLQRNILRLAVSAGASPFLQEVFPDFVSGQCSLLVFNAGNVRIFHFLKVEPDQLLGESGDGSESPKPFDPRQGGIDPVIQRRRKPPSGNPPIVEPGFPVAERRSSPSSEGPPLVQLLFDLRPPVVDLGRMEDVDGLFPVPPLFPDHDDAGGLRSGVDLDPDGLCFSTDSVFQPNGEGGALVDHGTAFSQKLPGPGRVAGHQGLLFLVQHKNLHSLIPVLTVFWPCGRDAPLAGRLPSGMLPTGVRFRPVSPLP